MRRALIIFLLLASILLGSNDVCAGIRNSKHDLTASSTGPSDSSLLGGSEVCIYCHAPHNPAYSNGKPLWNRIEPATTSFTMYGMTFAGTVTDTEPNRPSLQCLSCHDGATAVDAYGGNAGTSGKILGSPYVIGGGGVLGNEHPISISTAEMGVPTGTAASAGLIFYDDGGVPKVECPSCHDPHLIENGKFLRIGNQKSSLCKACHNK